MTTREENKIYTWEEGLEIMDAMIKEEEEDLSFLDAFDDDIVVEKTNEDLAIENLENESKNLEDEIAKWSAKTYKSVDTGVEFFDEEGFKTGSKSFKHINEVRRARAIVGYKERQKEIKEIISVILYKTETSSVVEKLVKKYS